MTNDTRIIKAAINPNFVDKLPNDNDKRFHVDGWENGVWTLEDFAQCIKNGWAYCPQLKGSRKKENFLCSNIISVDVDSGQSIDETLKDPFVVDHLALIYTTASHTSDYSRFRLIFILDRDIEDRDEQVRLNQALAYRFNGDRRATDPTRVFYGNTQSEPHIFNGILTDEALAPLLEVAAIPYKDDNSKEVGVSRRSKIRLDTSYQVFTGNGHSIALSEISGKIAVHCPFHLDRNPSAFAKRYPSGSLFLHCVKCRQTWWEKSDTDHLYQKDLYPDFVDTLKSLDDFLKIHPKIDDFLLRKFKADESFSRSRVIFSDEQYFSLPKVHQGITLVRSPKGSGKTSSLPEVMSPLLSRFSSLDQFETEDSDGPPITFDSDYRVLLIGHRQALIRELCARLNLHCYLDDESESAGPFNYRVRRYGVCLDSLWRVNAYDYDLIIIDESEQVLAHFLSKTFDKKQWTFDLLEAMIARTTSVIAMDADLGWTTYLTLCRMRNQYSMAESLKNQIHIYVNEYIAPARYLEMYDSKNHLTSKLYDDINHGRHVFVTSNSKRLIDSLFNAAKESVEDSAKLICVTSDNSKNQDVQHFITNVKTEAKKFTGIFCSPSLGTGIDITFEENLELVDCVYGFFEAGVTTHTDIDQQIGRVRHPKAVRCWVSKRSFNFETDFDIIASDLLVNHVAGNTALLIEPVKPEELYNENDEFLTMAALVVSQQRHSKNHLYQNFLEYKIDTGWRFDVIEKDDDVSVIGSIFLKLGKLITKQERTAILMRAETLDRFAFEEIKHKIEHNEWIPQQDKFNFYRTSLEKFYRQQISESLIDFDDGKNARSGIVRFEYLTTSALLDEVTERLKCSKRNRKKMRILEDNDFSIVLLALLLTSAGVYRKYDFDATVEYKAVELDKFVKNSLEYKADQEGQFGITVQRNVISKSTEHLSKLLKLVGLEQKLIRRKSEGDKRIHFYRLDQNRFNLIVSLVEQRNRYRDNPWDFINATYGFTPKLNDNNHGYAELRSFPRFNIDILPAKRTYDESRQRLRARGRNNPEKVIENRIPADISQLPKS